MNYSYSDVSFGFKSDFLKKIQKKEQGKNLAKSVETFNQLKQTAEKKAFSSDIFDRHNINVAQEEIFVNANKPLIRKVMDEFYSKFNKASK